MLIQDIDYTPPTGQDVDVRHVRCFTVCVHHMCSSSSQYLLLFKGPWMPQIHEFTSTKSTKHNAESTKHKAAAWVLCVCRVCMCCNTLHVPGNWLQMIMPFCMLIVCVYMRVSVYVCDHGDFKYQMGQQVWTTKACCGAVRRPLCYLWFMLPCHSCLAIVVFCWGARCSAKRENQEEEEIILDNNLLNYHIYLHSDRVGLGLRRMSCHRLLTPPSACSNGSQATALSPAPTHASAMCDVCVCVSARVPDSAAPPPCRIFIQHIGLRLYRKVNCRKVSCPWKSKALCWGGGVTYGLSVAMDRMSGLILVFYGQIERHSLWR